MDSAYARLQSRLIHVTETVKRIIVPDQNGDDVALFKNESYATCLTLEAELDEHVTIKQNPANVLVTAPLVNTTKEIVHVQESTKPANIYKWDVMFDGPSKESSSVTDWDSLVSKLESKELWQFIKTRKQKYDESVVIYVSVMESLSDRLSSPAAISTKIK